MNALGNATSISVISAEKLVQNGYAEYVKLETKYIEVEQSKKDEKKPNNEDKPKVSNKAKLLITLKRTSNFFELIEKLKKIKEVNDKYFEKEKSQI